MRVFCAPTSLSPSCYLWTRHWEPEAEGSRRYIKTREWCLSLTNSERALQRAFEAARLSVSSWDHRDEICRREQSDIGWNWILNPVNRGLANLSCVKSKRVSLPFWARCQACCQEPQWGGRSFALGGQIVWSCWWMTPSVPPGQTGSQCWGCS